MKRTENSLSMNNNLATTNPELAKEWHPTKNGSLKPTDVSFGSNKKVWWICKGGHEWQAIIKSRNAGKGCPICAGKQVLTGFNDFASKNPELVIEWNYEKNGNLTPDKIIAGSHTKVWWKCKKGHEWQATPNHRTSQVRNCPYCCKNPKTLLGENDLATIFPDIAEEWNYERNAPLTPEMFTSKSSKRVWWKCGKGHEWRTSIEHRANGSMCPKCSTAFQTSFPEQAVFYYVKKYYPDAINGYTEIFDYKGMELDIFIPSMNFGIEYDGSAFHGSEKAQQREIKKYAICKEKQIFLLRIIEKKTNKLIKDKCDCAIFTKENLTETIIALKEYLTLLKDIDVQKDQLEIMKNFKASMLKNSLKSKRPDLCKEWNYTKNDTLKPDMFSENSNTKVWWLCSKGHEWRTSIDTRSRGRGCPYCSNNKVLLGYNDLKTLRPDLMQEWHPTKNKDINPEMVTPGSGKKAWWICSKGHEWQAEISSRNKGHNCPICANMKYLKQ